MFGKRIATSAACAAAVLLAAGCSPKTVTGRPQSYPSWIPSLCGAALADHYDAVGDSGYQFLDAGKTAEAVACFTRQSELIPGAKWGYYNLACAYGRSGQKAAAWESLVKAVDNGWDDPGQLAADNDLESLRGNARFEGLVTQSRSTRVARETAFAQGLPRYDIPPVTFPDADSLARWMQAQADLMRINRNVLYAWQFTAAKMDFEARRIAALRLLRQGQPFDEGLERVRAIAHIKSIYEPWGPLTDGVGKEVRDYLAAKPDAAGQNEAHYWDGVAAYMGKRPENPSDSEWSAVAARARSSFGQVAAGSAFSGATEAWLLMLELAEAGENMTAVMPKIRRFAQTYRDDEQAMTIAGAFYQGDMVAALWPIPINAVDINQEPVSLDSYKGKVLLVDFWATWCGPCRGELPYILAAFEKHHPQGLEILSISLDYPEQTSLDAFRKWIADKGMSWRHIYDQKSWKGPFVKAYMVQGIPSPFLIGRDGSLVASGDGCRGENLESSIEKALRSGA